MLGNGKPPQRISTSTVAILASMLANFISCSASGDNHYKDRNKSAPNPVNWLGSNTQEFHKDGEEVDVWTPQEEQSMDSVSSMA